MNKTLVITGTHLTPAIALIEKLVSHNFEVIYLGRKNLAEINFLSRFKFKHFKIITAKFNRFNLFGALIGLFKLPLGFIQALYYLIIYRPRVVVSFGGFVGLPVCLAAKLLQLPLIIHEQTFASGLTSRLTGILADKIAISWEQSRKYFPASKTVLTGNPLRQEILKAQSLKAKPISYPNIYITGGNQGSQVINQAVKPILTSLLKKYQVIHQFGTNQSSVEWQQLPVLPRYQVKQWFSGQEVAQALTQASLVIGRSGINTISELAYLGKPAILIPLPYAQKNEQLVNARFLKKIGLGLILPQSKLTGQTLLAYINKAFSELPRQVSTTYNVDLIADASNKLYRLVTSLIHETEK